MICPRCGAENQPSAKICRMCATPLEAVAAAGVPKPGNFPPAVNMPVPGAPVGKAVNPPVGSAPGPGEILCPTCKAVNDATWAYCQQCGSQLHKMGAGKSAPAASVPAGAPVVPNKPMNNAPVPPMPPMTPPMAPPMVPQQMAPPPIAAIPPSPPIAPAAVVAPARNDNASAGGVISCSSCGRINTPGSSFCATCGAQLPADQTLMMAARAATPKLRLIQEGGGDGEIYKLDSDETVIGRNSGDIRFPHDGYMSGRHARIIRRGEHFVLVDENSRNGTFKRIDGEVELKAGDIILIGKQLFRFEL